MMVAVNHWLSGASPDVRGAWASQRPSESPTLTLDAFGEDAGFAALAWTRATSRCITDYQGNVHEIPAAAKPRNGVRVVRNCVTQSEVSNSSISKDASTTATTTTVTFGTANGSYYYKQNNVVTQVGARWIGSCYISCTVDRDVGLRIANSLSGTNDNEAVIQVTSVPQRVALELTATVAGGAVQLGIENRAAVVSGLTDTSTDGVFTITKFQFELARPGQTEPDEYVSVGVLSAPYHDGVGADGIRYFNTDENGARIDGTRGYDRDGTGAWVTSSDVDPIVPSIPVGVAQTNRITHPSALASWSTGGSPTVTAGYDAQVGTYTRITVSASDSVYLAASGFTGSGRNETALMLRMVSTSGTLRMSNVEGTVYGDIDIAAAGVSTTRFERVDRFHAAATVNTEFTATAGGAAGVKFDTESGSITVDVARVAQVQGERVHEIPVEATAVSTINADAPSFTALPTYATNPEGTFVFDFTPKAETAIEAKYFQMTHGPCYKNSADDVLWQYDGTNSPNFGAQVEGTRTKVATSWETGAGHYGYRDGVSKFAAFAYDGAWENSTMTLTGPMLLHRMQIYRSAEATTYLQGATA